VADEVSINPPALRRRVIGIPFAKGKDARRGVRKRKDSTIASALETARREGFNAIEVGILIVRSGYITEPDGTQTAVDVRSRLKLLRELTGYIHSKAPQAITAKVEHKHQHVDMTAIMMNPELAAAAQTLALAIEDQESKERGLPPAKPFYGDYPD